MVNAFFESANREATFTNTMARPKYLSRQRHAVHMELNVCPRAPPYCFGLRFMVGGAISLVKDITE